jgi:hypothetical protein
VGGDAVEVVAVARVAGLDATVLRASDATALARWLQGRGFASRQGLTDWLARYVAGGWYVTAFRYNGGRQVQFGSRAVRLSFSADRPFYPYAEPGDQTQSEPRTLRVTVVSDARMEGEIDGHAPRNPRPVLSPRDGPGRRRAFDRCKSVGGRADPPVAGQAPGAVV